MFRGKRIDNNEEVQGWYCKDDNEHYIAPYHARVYQEQETVGEEVLVLSGLVEVHPSSIGMQTGVLDKNKQPIYGSIEIDGEMSRGGHTVRWWWVKQKKWGPSAAVEMKYQGSVTVDEYEPIMGWWAFDAALNGECEIIGNQWDEESQESK